MICPKCDGTGMELEICCDGRDCACQGRPQVKGDCERCNGTGEIEEDC